MNKRHWPVGPIVFLIGGLFVLLFAGISLGILAIQQSIVASTVETRDVMVPEFLAQVRNIRNLEILRNYGNLAVKAADVNVRREAAFLATLIAAHPSSQGNENIRSLVANANNRIHEINIQMQVDSSEAGRLHALALWQPVDDSLKAYADELSVATSNLILERSTQIRDSARLVRYFAFALVLLFLVSSIAIIFFGRFLIVPIQTIARVLDNLSEISTTPQLPKSRLREIDGLYRAAELLADAIRERSEINTQLSLQKEAAEAANLAKSRFLAAASHDLRQPMQALTVFARLLDGASSNDVPFYIANIRRAADTLNGLFGGLLDLSTLDVGAVRPNITNVRIKPLIEEIIHEFSPKAVNKGLILKSGLLDIAINTDASLFQRIIRNLIDNAIKYTSDGFVSLDVIFSTPDVLIKIKDTGIGIGSEDQSKIFDEFYQLNNPSRNIENGTGLGLAIVKRLCNLLGHRIAVSSNSDQGSTFSLFLGPPTLIPIYHSTSSVHESKMESLKGLTVLVIDDNLDVCISMEHLLKSWQCVPCTVSSIEDAIKVNLFDVVIADYRLQNNETGFEAISLLRQRYGYFPAAIMTGEFPLSMVTPADLSDVQIFQKPLRHDDLALWLTNICNRYAQ